MAHWRMAHCITVVVDIYNRISDCNQSAHLFSKHVQILIHLFRNPALRLGEILFLCFSVLYIFLYLIFFDFLYYLFSVLWILELLLFIFISLE